MGRRSVMAKKKSAEQLREEARRLIEAARNAEKIDKQRAKIERDKIAVRIGAIVLEFHESGYSGFDLSKFKKTVAGIVDGNSGNDPKAAADLVPTSNDIGNNSFATREQSIEPTDIGAGSV
jgi:hypothetical protein